MGVITTPFSNYSCVVVLVDHWTSDGKEKQHTEFLFSHGGQWLDESNEGAPFLSLSCPAMARVLAWAYSLTKISLGLFFAVWLVPSKTAKFNHPRKFVPIRYERNGSNFHPSCVSYMWIYTIRTQSLHILHLVMWYASIASASTKSSQWICYY